MVMGKYEEAAKAIEDALRYHPLSLYLLKLGHEANLYCSRPAIAAEKLSEIYRYATRSEIAIWDPTDLVALGKALLLQGTEPKLVLGELYNRALRLDPDCREAYLAIGELALDKQDYELAADQYRKGIEQFADDPDMHFGLAQAFYNSDRKSMIESLNAALYLNSNHVPTLLLLAEHQIDCEDYDSARNLLNRVTSVNSRNPEAWAFRCVLAYMSNDAKAAEQNRATALKSWSTNPNVDYIIGSKLSLKYRFSEGATYQRQALKFDPEFLPAKIQLAQDLLRLGREEEGWKLAEEVYSQDRYNVLAYNMVNLGDHISTFKTIESGRFIVRMDKTEAEAYGHEVIELLTQAEEDLCKKYGITLDQNVVIEYFPDQQDFAVRTFGVPGGDGFLGVCFGNVITANSPKAERPSNWKSTLWHEFCHVVTLNKTKNKMPRWLSEGISVYEESQRDPTCGHKINPEYRRMILEGELTPISELSGAFLSPPTSMHLQFAYYESSLVVEFIVKKYGYESLKEILSDLADGEDIQRALTRHTDSMKKIEKEFADFARKRAEDLAPDVDWEKPEEIQLIARDPNILSEWLKEHPNSFWALTVQATYLMNENNWEQAKEPLNKILQLYPEYTGEDNAYQLLAIVHRNLDETEQEKQILEKLASISSDALNAYERLIEIAINQENWQEVVNNCEKYMAVYPLINKVHWQLGSANEKLGKDQEAIEAYQRLLHLDYADPADLNFRLGRLLEDKDPATAKRYVLTALAEAPRFRQAHSLLLRLVEENQQQEPVSEDQNEMETSEVKW
jgi:tetratricopeptide (TPR) repeat protein